MLVAYILDEFPSASEYFILNEIVELVKRGFTIQVLAMRKNNKITGHEIAGVLYEQGCFSVGTFMAHLYLMRTVRKRYVGMIKKITKLRQLRVFLTGGYFLFLLRKMPVEHIHAHFCSIPADIAMIMSELSGIGFSCSAHSRDIFTGNKEGLRVKINKARFFITCTSYNRLYLQQIAQGDGLGKIFHLYHGIDLAKWPEKKQGSGPSRHDKVRILTVCRLVGKKGIFFLLEAIKMLRDTGLTIECSIVGEGPLRREIEKYIDMNGLRCNIHLQGMLLQSAVKPFYLSADIFVLPAIVADDGDRDGLPNVLVEAMAVGVPVITTAVSAIPELVVHEFTGLLVPEKSPEAIRDAIVRLISEEELCHKIARNGRRKVKAEFSIHTTTDRMVEIFTSNRQGA
ncbi:glycosyltransferase [Puia dinghuensis]|uniref:Colanic acid biosynthesis glycosyltransferase WcaL n=1 Tax=Puia dinghuensis TaxID=1792502 RepID=A0A8J2UIR9_9BACT|nr:glycosyltransferase [Puia dinghuensis]GGB24186.1 colanic acid biosynthesis glycosyltransferase WcaL [Puia dinghuensis]